MIDHLFSDTCAIYRKTVASRAANNDPVYTSTLVATVKCRLSVSSSNPSKEGFDPHAATITSLKIFLPDCDVGEDDTLTVDGIDYRIIGVTERKSRVSVHHIECDVERVDL